MLKPPRARGTDKGKILHGRKRSFGYTDESGALVRGIFYRLKNVKAERKKRDNVR